MILTSHQKNKALELLEQKLLANSTQIIEANQKDLSDWKETIDETLYDRLIVGEKKVNGMVSSVKEVREMEDPIGKTLYSYNHPNGIKVENKVVPFGTILIIYESRPDVTIEAAISAFKAGNKILLKGGKEARNTNLYLIKLWKEALDEAEISNDFVEYLDFDRTETQKLLAGGVHNIDLIIPRGGEGLINYIKQNTNIPLLISGRGNNYLFIDEFANPETAIKVALNGKSRLSVCNAIDKILIHKNLPNLSEFLEKLVSELKNIGLEVFTEGEDFSSIETEKISSKDIFSEEFLSAKVLLKVVENIDEAIQMSNEFSGGHSSVIITENDKNADQYLLETDCAAVFHNTSSRFNDGGQFGFGGEIAISTQKIHFRGPVGMNQLVTNKWYVKGNGQIR